MKKLISFILCLTLMLSMGLSAGADFVSKWKNADTAPVPTAKPKSGSSSFVQKWANGEGSGQQKGKKDGNCLYGGEDRIKLPEPDCFFDDALEVYYYDELEDYIHICYDSELSQTLLDEYMELLEDDYGMELYIQDYEQNVYGFEYSEGCVETFYPGYGFKDRYEVAVLICSADGYTHAYCSTDFCFTDTGDRTNYEIVTGNSDCA